MGRFGALWNPRPQRCPRDPACPGPSSPPRAFAGLAVQSSSGSGLRPRPAPASPGPSPGGSVPRLLPTPSPRPRDKPCLVSPSASRVFGGLGLRLFSRAESQAQLLLTAGSASLFPEPSPRVGIQALSSAPWRARVSPEGAADHGYFGPGTPVFAPAAVAAAATAPCDFCLRSTPGLEPCQPR